MNQPLHLPDVTMVAITDRDHGKTIEAILKSLKHIRPARTILFADVPLASDQFECIVIEPLRSAQKYNEFVTWKLGSFPINTSHILLVQYDGYVLDSSAWTDEFLDFDYIGAPWTYTDGRNVGNGGFSLRSKRLHTILARDPSISVGSPEDEIICRLFRGYLETHHGIKYAPEALAHKFSFEMHRPVQKTFGFHNKFFPPYKEPIVLRHKGSMGDLIMLEPVMDYFHQKGQRVILDCQEQYFNLFVNHEYPIEFAGHLYGREDLNAYRTINFEMAYEVTPKQIVLQSYYDVAGIKDFPLRNAKLNWRQTGEFKLFDKYAILHINETDMPHRNLRGIDWILVSAYLMGKGYLVFQVGGREIAKINTANTQTLAYIIGGADLVMASDSGIAHIAQACGVKTMIFFGSVLPRYRYLPAGHIIPMTNDCTLAGCYHDVVGTRGQDCYFDVDKPPCTIFSTEKVIEKLNQII